MTSANHIYIKTDKDLTETEVARIRNIFNESNCPNESLRYTFGDAYHGINSNGEHVFIFGTNCDTVNMTIEY